VIGNQIWHEGATLPEFQFLIAGIVGFLILVVLLPFGFFAPDGRRQTGGAQGVRVASGATCRRISAEVDERIAVSRPRTSRQLGYWGERDAIAKEKYLLLPTKK